MRLINTETGEFQEFVDLAKIPPYAILSHTWDPTGEQTYQEVVKIQDKYKAQHPVPEENALSNSHSDIPEPAVAEVPTPSEAHTTSSHSPLLMSRENPRSRSMWRHLCMQPARICSNVRTWFYHTGRTTGLSKPETPSVPAGRSDPELPNDTQTPSPPPTVHRSIWDSDSGLSEKVRKACEIARRDGYRYIWIDSCCINKDSSSELSEAINSMFNWYRGSQICYAFLPDVPSNEDARAEGSKFRKSRWFTRGWTLQELIAPLVVVFLSQAWEGLGTKDILADVVQDVTSIDRGILRHEKPLSDESVADRMRWASQRETTRVEDEAYSLLGIFGITMPTLYGEGRYAFRRLQEEILQRIPDQSLFAWGSECMPFPLAPSGSLEILVGSVDDSQTAFAPSPRSFASSRDRIIPATGYSMESLKLPVEEYTHTPFGIRTQFCLLPLKALNPELEMSGFGSATVSWYLAILRSRYASDPRRLLGRLCFLPYDYRSTNPFLHVPDWIVPPAPREDRRGLDGRRRNALIFTLSLDDLERVKDSTQLQTKTIYLPHPKPPAAMRLSEGKNDPVNMTLPEWNQAALRMHGYTISDIQRRHAAGDHSNLNSASLTLSHPSIQIHIEYRQMFIRCSWFGNRDAIVIQARIWLLCPGSESGSGFISQSNPAQAVQSDTPPYTSATWADDAPWAMTLPARSVHLPADSGEGVSLRLGLDLTTPSRYNIRVEVAPAASDPAVARPSLRPDLKDLPKVLDAPQETFKLVLLGSVRRALEAKGYSAQLELGPSIGGFHSHSLILSGGADPRFVIVVKFFHTLDNDGLREDSQALVVVARATLESESPSVSAPSYDDSRTLTYQDGPYVAIWSDRTNTWKWSWEEKHIVLTTPTEESLTLHLGFDYAWQSEYYLHVDVEPGTSRFRPPPEPWHGRHAEYPYSLDGIMIHGSVALTLPGHIKRALQRKGYRVRFERLDVHGLAEEPARYRLTLSKVDAGFVIVVDYSHNLTTSSAEPDYVPSVASKPDSGLPTDSSSESDDPPIEHNPRPSRPPRQELTFQACVQALPSPSSGLQGDIQVPARGESVLSTIEWNARHPRVGVWRRHLPRKDLTLVLPQTRRRLTIRLGFYLVWYSEYCLMVEIDPHMPLSRTTSRPDPPPISPRPHGFFNVEASAIPIPAESGWPYTWARPLRVGHESAEVDDGLFGLDTDLLTTPETVHFQHAEHTEIQGAGRGLEDGDGAMSFEVEK